MKINKNSVLLNQDIYLNASQVSKGVKYTSKDGNKEKSDDMGIAPRLSTKINATYEDEQKDKTQETTLNHGAIFIKDEIVKLEDNKAKKSEYKNLEKFDNIDYKEFSKEKLSLFSGSLSSSLTISSLIKIAPWLSVVSCVLSFCSSS
jgi:hypothetical protein